MFLFSQREIGQVTTSPHATSKPRGFLDVYKEAVGREHFRVNPAERGPARMKRSAVRF
jgi:hypothetical protein